MDEDAQPDAGSLLAPPQPAAPPPQPGQGGPDLGLLILFVGVLAFVAITNLWLRRRAEREGGEGSGE